MGTVAKLLVVVLFVSAIGVCCRAVLIPRDISIEVDLNAAPTHSSDQVARLRMCFSWPTNSASRTGYG